MNNGMHVTPKKLKQLAKLVRYWIIRSTTEAGSGHPSSSLSAVDLMAVLLYGGFFTADIHEPHNPHNDRLIFSKGHAAPLLYVLYALAHGIPEQELLTLRKFGSRLEGHPTMVFPYAEVATGSLGQGLSIGVGLALNAQYLDKTHYKTFVLLGDSEMAEGSVWEALQIAAHYKLHSLVGILDVNRLGQRGETMYGHRLKEYAERIAAFGWKTMIVDGHDIKKIIKAYDQALSEKQRPVMIIARTVKGKGVKFIENKDGWHGKTLSEDEAEEAIDGLGDVTLSLRGVIFKSKATKPPHTPILKPTPDPAYALGDKVSTRKAYGQALASVFSRHPGLVALDAEVGNSTYAEIFKQAHPERFFEMYIAEQNMVGAAIGLSARGKIPFVSTFAAFFTRAADQIRMSQYSMCNPAPQGCGAGIKFVGSHAGVSIGEDGASQMALEDISLFRTQLGSVVLYPSDAISTGKLVEEAAKHVGNVYIRTTRKDTPVIYKPEDTFPIGGSKVLKSSPQDVATVVGAGVTLFEALAAYEILKKENIFIRVIDLYSIKPIDAATLTSAARETKVIMTVEDHYVEGGLGEAVAAALAGEVSRSQIAMLAVKKMPKSGKPDELLAYEEINATAIVREVKKFLA
ncbi:MAG: transketolase [Candidatus Magasanikbacteria bacterium]|nr:transketolase [Candidatus Magasanikbacteria bacterium]